MIDPRSEKVILRFWSGGHNGGCLDFGNDGYLYISTGDGADPSPPDGKLTGQDCSDLLSSILRIDVDHAEAGQAVRDPGRQPVPEDARRPARDLGVRLPQPLEDELRPRDRRPVGRRRRLGALGDDLPGRARGQLRLERHGRARSRCASRASAGPRRSCRRSCSIPTPRRPRSPAATSIAARACPSWRVPTSTAIIRPAPSGASATTARRSPGSQELARTPLHLVAFGEAQRRRALPGRPRPDPSDLSPGAEPRREGASRLPPPAEPDRALRLGAATISRPRASSRTRSTSSSGPTARRPSGSWRCRATAASPSTTGQLAVPRGLGAGADGLDRDASRASRRAAAGSRPRSSTSRPSRGGPTPTSGTTTRRTPSWPTRRARAGRSPWPIPPRRGASGRSTTAFTRGSSASSAIIPGSRRRPRSSAPSRPRRWV